MSPNLPFERTPSVGPRGLQPIAALAVLLLAMPSALALSSDDVAPPAPPALPAEQELELRAATGAMMTETQALRAAHPELFSSGPPLVPDAPHDYILGVEQAAHALATARTRAALGVAEGQTEVEDPEALRSALVGGWESVLAHMQGWVETLDGLAVPAGGEGLRALADRAIPVYMTLGHQEFHDEMVRGDPTLIAAPRLAVQQLAAIEMQRVLVQHLPPATAAFEAGAGSGHDGILDVEKVAMYRDRMAYPRQSIDLDVSLPEMRAATALADGRGLSALMYSLVAWQGHIHGGLRDEGLRTGEPPDAYLAEKYTASLSAVPHVALVRSQQLAHGYLAGGHDLSRAKAVLVASDAAAWLGALAALQDDGHPAVAGEADVPAERGVGRLPVLAGGAVLLAFLVWRRQRGRA